MADEQTDAAATAVEQTPDAGGTSDKTFTQAELDKIVQDRLAREARKDEKSVEKLVAERLAAELEKQKLSEAERLKIEKDEAERKAQDAIAHANARLLAAEAKAQALSLGVKPEFVDDVITLCKISGDAFLTDGEPDVSKIQTGINAVLANRPFYKGNAAAAAAGVEFGGNQHQAENLLQASADALAKGDVVTAMRLKAEHYDKLNSRS